MGLEVFLDAGMQVMKGRKSDVGNSQLQKLSLLCSKINEPIVGAERVSLRQAGSF